ncbi:uncharacterized protein LOC100575051 isoform X2 [Acyrthosiphon pisum]|uniref:DUF19 domain-containing protein n=1 Tax=Acyrthosiphon pisum TaxID=7029 RepID=A0A8R2ADU3_ACYPI|nr:uncharacterized protein LOC100575051 isoform X2 [Acyrthosiphon pisum]|eukprot:XP_003244052.1 PREDICTED: uncharacterized protein LOC100575051 isoform X2 [Acyrthosiphon pisum]
MSMLKLFFIIGTMVTLAQSQIAVEWICKDAKLMGNCTRMPKITDLLQTITQNSEDGEYEDFHYCPQYIVERHIKCMQTYYNGCYRSMSEILRNTFMAFVPLPENAKTLCDKTRPYKKEFREHSACTKALLYADEDWYDYVEDSEMQYGQQMDDMNVRDQCKIVNCYWRDLTTRISEECGPKTEKFSHQVLSYIWPMSMMSKLCSEFLTLGPL